MLPDIIHRYSAQRANCKQWSVFLAVAILLVGALGKLSAANLLWAAAPLLLLGLAEAGYAGQERRCAELLKSRKGNEEVAALLPEGASASILRTAVAAMSLSVGPFYLGLFAIVAAGGGAMNSPGRATGIETAARPMAFAENPRLAGTLALPNTLAGCGSGGCGSAKGCGTGSCGASSGKGCSCGGGTTTAAARPVQQYVPTNTQPLPLQPGQQRPAAIQTFPVRPPLNPVMPQNAPTTFQPAVRPMNPGQNPAHLQPAATAPASAAAAPGTSD
jgi:hypothetical protein